MSKRTAIYLNIIKVLGDVIPAGQASEFLPSVLKISANDSACGLGGLVSAILTSYQLYEWFISIKVLLVFYDLNEIVDIIIDCDCYQDGGLRLLHWFQQRTHRRK